MIHKDTIIALATPSGVGAISVIRLSGENAIQIVDANFRSVRKNKVLKNAKTHTIHLGHIMSNGVVLDEVLVAVFKNPRSYTGENVVEISCHGSRFIQQEIIQLFLEKGCRMADNGEFTMRAFLNGKNGSKSGGSGCRCDCLKFCCEPSDGDTADAGWH